MYVLFRAKYVLRKTNAVRFFSSMHEQMKKYTTDSSTELQGTKKQLQEINQTNETVDTIVKKRRAQQKYLQLQDAKKKDAQIFVQAYSDTVIDFQLYMEHTCYQSQEIESIMNYYGLAFKRNMNPYYLKRLKLSFPNLKEQKWPIMRVHVSLDPVKFVVGTEQIEQFLVDNYFISVAKHRTNSVWAQQGRQFAIERVRPVLERLFWHPILTYERLFKSNPDTYRQGIIQRVLFGALHRMLAEVAVQSSKNVIKILRHRNEYKKSRDEFLQLMDEWKGRLGDKPFHGGEEPDEADFALLAVFKTFYNSRSFKKFVENKFPLPTYRWVLRMLQKCKYESDRQLYAE